MAVVYQVSTNKEKLDIELIHRFLSEESTWAKGINIEIVKKSICNSLCFGLYADEEQIGYARVISDFATYGTLVDVFVVRSERGKGLSKLLINEVLAHPDLQALRRFNLTSSTAQWLYKKVGFSALSTPETHMEIFRPDIYKDAKISDVS
jgi:hypothetical protein